MNRKLIFQGSAGEALGKEWNVNAPVIADAFRLVAINKPEEFKTYFSQNEGQDEFSVQIADQFLTIDELFMHNLQGNEIIVTPIPEGSRRSRGRRRSEMFLKAVVILIIAYYLGKTFGPAANTTIKDMTWGEFIAVGAQNMLYMMGTNLAMQALSDALSDDPSNDADEEGSMFSGPTNTIKHGQPVPVCYGKLLVGGVPINFGFGSLKINPTHSITFQSDNPTAWDGVVYDNDIPGDGFIDDEEEAIASLESGGGGNATTIDWWTDILNDEYYKRRHIEEIRNIGF